MVAEYLQRSQTTLIPIGSTEQHGPNGYIGTDALCPEAIAGGGIGSVPSMASTAHGENLYQASIADVREDLDRLES